MKRQTLRKIGQALREMGECPDCGGSRLVLASSWRGHGTGRRGEAHYGAAGHEPLSPKRHCTCPGGPLWQALLASEFGQELKLAEGERLYPHLPAGQMAYYDADQGGFCAVAHALFRRAVIAAAKDAAERGQDLLAPTPSP